VQHSHSLLGGAVLHELICLILGCVFFLKIVSKKLLFKFLCIYLLLKKLINGKYFPVKEKFDLIFRKVSSFYF